MLVSPVKTTLALSLDPSYRGHVGFLAISVALSAVIGGSAVSGALEQTSTEVVRNPDLAGNAVLRWWLDVLAAYRKELLTLASYAVIAVHLLMNFLVLKTFRPRNNVTLGKYFKLFCIASAFYLIAWTLADAFNVIVFGQDPSALAKALVSSGAWPAVRDYIVSPPGLVSAVTGLDLSSITFGSRQASGGCPRSRCIVSLPLVLIASAIVVGLLELVLLATVGL